MKLRVLLACLLFATLSVLSLGVFAGRTKNPIESSLLVTGSVDIDAAGEVKSFALDQPDKLPRGIVDLVGKFSRDWKFEPIPLGDRTVSRSRMSLLFVASKLEHGQYRVELRNANFDEPNPALRVSIDPASRVLPRYPFSAMGTGVEGTVYLSLRFDRDGNVLDIASEQVNLRVLGNRNEMAQWRASLEYSAISAAKRWRMLVPAGAIPANETYGVGRVAVSYTFDDTPETRYGRWETYVAGPRANIPWHEHTPLANTSPEALAPGDFYAAGNGRRLLTPLTGG